MTNRDLVRLRDIGPSFGTGLGTSPLAVSPDGRQLALVLTRADPDADDYCQALVVIGLRTTASARVLDLGRGVITSVPTIRGVRSPSGSPIINTPRWSPDGRHLAYLRSEGGVAQARVVTSDGRHAVTVSRAATDILRLGWAPNGRLVFADDPGVTAAARAIEQQGRRGFLYDDTFIPNASARPSLPDSGRLAFHSVGSGGGTPLRASNAERRGIDPAPDGLFPAGALLTARSSAGLKAWTISRDPTAFLSPVDLWIERADGVRVKCDDPACAGGSRGLENLWWTEHGRTLVFQRRGGWGGSQEMLFRWSPGNAPRQIVATDDLLTGCALVDTRLACLREASARPRRVVLIDTGSGAQTELFDPNPEVAQQRLSTVERLHWKNAVGLQCFGDLVLPAGYKPGTRVPLIVVQYLTRGFLRGGTGDEYPIFPLAAQGFAILSFQRPPDFYETVKDGSLKSVEDAWKADQQDWHDRRSVQSALIRAIEILVERGIADKTRLGITGASDGATSVQFALASDPGLFAAASVSSPFMEANSTQIYGGTAWARQLREMGYPALGDAQAEAEFWRPISITMNTQAIVAPILMQVADDEYLVALESYVALRAQGKVSEFRVFPREYHMKTEPVHRLAIYERNLDWFSFWLLSKENPNPQDAGQYIRWRAMKDRQAAWSKPIASRLN